MNVEKAREYLRLAQIELDESTVNTADEFDRIYSTTTPETPIRLSTSFVYGKPLVLSRPSTILGPSFVGRVPADIPLPRFLAGVTIPGNMVVTSGVEFRHVNPLTEVVNMDGAHVVLNQTRILGDVKIGAKRGINYTGAYGQIIGCLIDDIFQPAQDTQAIYCQEMGPGGLLVENCGMFASGEVMCFGGGDIADPSRVPRGLELHNSLLSKKVAWLTTMKCKNALEFKSMIGANVKDCTFEFAGMSEGQGGYLIVCTPRNQNGGNPFVTVQDITIANCFGAHASGAISVMGSDSEHSSGPLLNAKFKDLSFTDMGFNYLGAKRLFYLGRAPQNVTYENITAGGSFNAGFFFDNGQPPTGLVIRNVSASPCPYPWHNPSGETMASVVKFAPGTIIENSNLPNNRI